jgi:hypothetical protein
MTRPDPRAQKPFGPGRIPRGESNPNAHSILPVWAIPGHHSTDPAPSPNPPDRSADSARVGDTDARLPVGFAQKAVCKGLSLSVRTWTRARAQGLTPPPDPYVGKSPRWLATTIERGLKTRPKLPGRGRKGGGHGK